MREMTLHVNGCRHRVVLDPQTPLVYALRNDLGLVGIRFGCGQQLCGACHVLIDGAVTASCELPTASAEAGVITTVESADDPRLDALRRAFVAEQAAQCGACSSGMLISAAALLTHTPAPDEADVRRALNANICRCGTHQRIVRAVIRAAQELHP
ncbi:MAG TPA: 2Fe-2S iron-sulfur cluster-binding protein [Acidimicrobiales bacterium]|nr:2Fe-2S iron-sulfur cluster-binding protein [Acidimicrobiales bacterium]